MTLTVRQFPCLSDNYGFLIRDEATGKTATIDTPDAVAILVELAASGWGRLDYILNTHWHPDHAGGNARLKAEQLRILLALMVLAVSLKLGVDLLLEPRELYSISAAGRA